MTTIKKSKLNSNVGYFLLEMAKDYRNNNLAFGILPSLCGEKMEEENIRKVIEPFIKKVSEILSLEIETELKVCLESFLPEAIEQMYINPDMHYGDETGKINQDNTDALLFMFLHWSCDLKDASVEYLVEF